MPVLILDGGMGTTLENLGHDVSGRMWGCELVDKAPEVITNVHARYIAAGADLIETATYQMTVPALIDLGHDEASASAVCRKAVSLAASAWSSSAAIPAPSAPSSPLRPSSRPSASRSSSSKDSRPASAAANANPSRSLRPKVALALGPFGATLSPGQEYGGLYPPPYGPSGPALHDRSSKPTNNGSAGPQNDPSPSPPTNYVASKDEEDGYESALAHFHLSRLRVFASDPETWAAVSWIAFETVPLLREIRAIRRAMGKLRSELKAAGLEKDGEETPFWIASAYPEGKIGQRDAKGQSVGLREVADALVGDLAPLAGFPTVASDPPMPAEAETSASAPIRPAISPSASSTPLPVPAASGTEPATESALSDGISASASASPSVHTGSEVSPRSSLGPIPNGLGINCTHHQSIPTLVGGLAGAVARYRLKTRPWLVLYPDGGAVYDTVTRTWSGKEMVPQLWAERLLAQAHEAEGTGVWHGVIIGGCCKSGFEEIAALRKLADRPMERQWEKSTAAAWEKSAPQAIK